MIISYAVVLTLLIASTVVGIVNFVKIGSQVTSFYNGPYVVKDSANLISSSFEELQKFVYRAISNSDLQITNESIENAKKANTDIQDYMTVVKKNYLGDMSNVERLEAALTDLNSMREQVLNMAAENKNSDAAAYMEQYCIPTIDKAQALSLIHI